MIFLSHNHKDKPVVEPIALKLASAFGMSNVFYDNWSIQPCDDGIISGMNKGLEECKFFFYFVSQNSLASKMVKLEWENALMKATKGNCKIIAIRLDKSQMPAILMQKLYLDFFSNGFDVTLRQMNDIIAGQNTFRPQYQSFDNLEATTKKTAKGLLITITAKYFMEPKSNFMALLDNERDEVQGDVLNVSLHNSRFAPNVTLDNGLKGNAWSFSATGATTPGFPFEIDLTQTKGKEIKLLAVLHETKRNHFQTISLK